MALHRVHIATRIYTGQLCLSSPEERDRSLAASNHCTREITRRNRTCLADLGCLQHIGLAAGERGSVTPPFFLQSLVERLRQKRTKQQKSQRSTKLLQPPNRRRQPIRKSRGQPSPSGEFDQALLKTHRRRKRSRSRQARTQSRIRMRQLLRLHR